jgi:protein-disulfide isomerase
VQNSSFNEVIAKDLADATALQLQGTPSFFVNGKAVDSVANLDSAIKAGLAE